MVVDEETFAQHMSLPAASYSSYSNINSVNVIAILVTAVAGVAAAAVFYSKRGHLKSPYFLRRKHPPLSPQQWSSAFTSDGRLIDGGLKVLKIVCRGGVDSRVRAEVWPFLLGVYDFNSTRQEREQERVQRREEYEMLRQKCKCLQNEHESGNPTMDTTNGNKVETCKSQYDTTDEPAELAERSNGSFLEFSDVNNADSKISDLTFSGEMENIESGGDFSDGEYISEYDSMMPKTSDRMENIEKQNGEISDNESVVEDDFSMVNYPATVNGKQTEESVRVGCDVIQKLKERGPQALEDFSRWQRIIRLDAVRMNAEWVPYSPSQANVSNEKASALASSVGLESDEHLEACRKNHAARLVAILEAYALFDPETGYCQGMSDLLSPFVALIDEDYEAFWCFVYFMHSARHNFRLDEMGIRRQLNMIAKIVQTKDPPLYEHLHKVQAEDFFFVYRMVLVLFRRELTFEQTLCLWEVIWANQAAVRLRIEKTSWQRGKLKAPPTSDLLLYTIAASVLQKRKVIIEKHSDLDEILRECNDMAGHLDVWKLLEEAYDLVVCLQGKI